MNEAIQENDYLCTLLSAAKMTSRNALFFSTMNNRFGLTASRPSETLKITALNKAILLNKLTINLCFSPVSKCSLPKYFLR